MIGQQIVMMRSSSYSSWQYNIKVTRGQWMSDKWGSRKKEGYLKIHIAVDIKTKEILALEVTDEKVHDSKMMKKLVKHVLNNNNNTTRRRKRKNKIHSFI
jgi:hypothetical protein